MQPVGTLKLVFAQAISQLDRRLDSFIADREPARIGLDPNWPTAGQFDAGRFESWGPVLVLRLRACAERTDYESRENQTSQ
jgi:hypothetical protein